jgi:hypothetical protein
MIPYERIVEQDLNLGYGTQLVTMPAGGSALGRKIGLHTFTRVYNVRDFGAQGDGLADDTTAIQAAIDQAGLDGDAYGCVFFPPGSYKVTGTIRYAGNGLALVGVGANTSGIVHAPSAADTDCVVFASPTDAYQSDNSVRGLTIESSSGLSRYLLDINGQEGFLVDHAYVTGGQHALRVNNAIHGRFAFCKFRGASSHGVRIGDTGFSVTTMMFSGCYISSNAGAGVYSESGSQGFTATIFESNGTYGLYCPTGGARVSGCHFEANPSGCVRGGDTWPGAVYTYFHSQLNTFVSPGAAPGFELDYGVLESNGDYFVSPTGAFVQQTAHTKRIQIASDPIPPTAVTINPITNADTGVVRGSLGAPAEGFIALGNSGISYDPIVRDGAVQTLTINSHFTMGVPTGSPVMGQTLTFQLLQDGSGGWNVSWNAVYKHCWSNGGNIAASRSAITFVYDGTNWVQRAYIPWNSATAWWLRNDLAGIIQTLLSDLKLSSASPTYYLTSTTPSTGKEWAIFTLGASGIFRIDDDTSGLNEFYIDPVNDAAMIRRPLRVNNTIAALHAGSGSPEAAVSAPVGSIYLRTNGGAATCLYVKESGGSGNTGWVAK